MTDIKKAVETFSGTVSANAKVLDVGCGLRPYEVFFKHAKYTGVDVPQSGRDSSGKLPDFEFDGINLPFDDGSFDVAICNEVLEHAVNPDALLREISRVLTPSGRIMVTVPFMWGLHELPYDFRRYTTVGIRAAIETAGFEIEFQEKLTKGTAAIRMLISSETNYYLNHVAGRGSVSTPQRFGLWLQDWLLRFVFALWERTVKFERIYIDNLIVARKLDGAGQNVNLKMNEENLSVLSVNRNAKRIVFLEKVTRGQHRRMQLSKLKSMVKSVVRK